MTLPTIIKELIKKRYGKAWSTTAPNNVHVVAKDMMQHIKGTLPDSILTVNDLLSHLTRIVRLELSRRNGCSTVIICFDTKTVDVKSIVEYGTRKEWRCKHCKKLPQNTFASMCGKNCVNLKPLKFEDGPHLPLDHSMPLPVKPKEWMRFAADSRNLRRELYPILMNCFLEGGCFVPLPGQTVILYGLPCKTQVVPIHNQSQWNAGFNASAETTREILVKWRLDSSSVDDEYRRFDSVPISNGYLAKNPDMYNQVYGIENVNNMIYRRKMSEMFNRIPEADNSIFFFMKFYPKLNYMVDINDGDAISIGLLRVLEDFVAGECLVDRYIALPNRKKPKPGELYYSHDYINIVKLIQLIEADVQYTAANVANPVATLVFLIILGKTDFFKNFCKGIGYKTQYKEDEAKRAKQREGIWDTFHARLPTFSHMVQWNIRDMIADPTVERRIIIDEQLFMLFTQYCYWHKYGKTDDVDFASVRAHCKKFKNKQNHMPTKQQMMLWVRQVDWNLQYWLNDCRDIRVDPFKAVDGEPYYGYVKKTMSISKRVHATQQPVDEVYKRHFYKRRKKQKTAAPKTIQKKRKQSAMDAVRGKI